MTLASNVIAMAADFDELDAKIQDGMNSHAIPGVAVAVVADGQEYIKGYGVTNVDHPVPVDGDTVFRIGSTTKTFTGTAAMRLVDQGRLELDAPVQRYLPDFAVSDPKASAEVTVRHVLNHTPGWLGDNLQDFGRGDDALAEYVASMAPLPQLTAPGSVFAYNNAGLVVAGRIIEVVTGSTYEDAVRELVIDPLELGHTRFFSDEIIGFNIAAAHKVTDGKPVVDNAAWEFPRSCNPTGALMSSARDQLRYAGFHLGDGTATDGTRLLSRDALVAMRSNPGPGGTLQIELTGIGITWMLRPSAEGPTVAQHGGTWQGQQSGFFMVPDRGFAMTVLTNSDGGAHLLAELFADDWSLRRFAGVSNPPATPANLSASDLSEFEGRYMTSVIAPDGKTLESTIELHTDDGRLDGTITTCDPSSDAEPLENNRVGFAFYRPDFALDIGQDGKPSGTRSDFVRDPDGAIAWLRNSGRLFSRQ
jgi:CubicO group peptidase (beta-lactamase class C family)